MTVEKCYVRHTKTSLDITDPSLLVQEVISSFGHYMYIKFKVRGASGKCDTQPTGPVQNAFAVLMQSQRDLSLPTLPDRIPAHTKKDDLLEQMNLTLPRNEAGSGGKQLV